MCSRKLALALALTTGLGSLAVPLRVRSDSILDAVSSSSSSSESTSSTFFSPPDATFVDSGPQAQGVLYYDPSSSTTATTANSSSSSPSRTASLDPSISQATTATYTSTLSSTSPIPSATQAAAITSELPDSPLVLAYFADWTVWQRTPESIDFTKFDVINYAFAIPNEKFDLNWNDPNSSPGTLRRLVDVAGKAGKRVVLSIGGWSGSKYFSPAVATELSRQTFVANIIRVYQEYLLSGIDIDWEYPGRQGEGSNLVSPDDTANFLAFLKLLRSSLPEEALLTAAVATTPFVDAVQRPLEDVSAFAELLDWVTIMAYDAFGASENPGPNAPFSDECRNSTQPEANMVAAYNAWTTAGFDADQLVMGVAAYGYHSRSTASHLRTREIGAQISFNTLVAQSKLVRSAIPPYPFVAGLEYERIWDDCSSTPFLRSETHGEVITYDDPQSLTMKAQFVKEVGIRGVNFWSLDGDTEEWDLVNSVRDAWA